MFGLKVSNFLAGACGTALILALTPCFAGPENTPYLFTEAPRFDPNATLGSGERFPAGARLMVSTGAAPRALVAGFAASASATVSFDGKRVLFQGRHKPGDPWRIYEVPLSGQAPRPLTSVDEDSIRPFYLPDDKFVYSRRTPAGYQLEIAPLAGGAPLRLTYSPGHHIATDVLQDGRILFEAPHPGTSGRDIFAVYTDGSGVETIRCDHARDRHAGHQLSSGEIVFETGGTLAKFVSARAVQLPVMLPKGEYAGPVADLPSGDLLVAYRAGANAPYTVCRVKPGGAATTPVPVASAAKANAVEPVIVQPRRVPPRHPSSLGDRNGANILCLNAYTTRGPKIAPGLIHAVRVFARDESGKETRLGETAVEKDGSFYLNVPSEHAIRFELLDRNAAVVRAEKGWFWLRRGEQRVCVGCHAGPERAPENDVPAVLMRTTDPVKMLLAAPQSGAASGGSR